MTILERFQSTPPVWEATTYVSQLGTLQTSVSIHASRVGGDAQDKPSNTITASFNPRLPCGRRQYSGFISEAYNAVSIHASRVGGDRIASALSCISRQFQSTPPVWEATNWSDADELGNVVSIHASRVGGDSMALYRWARMTCFNPRLPCGRRHDAQYQQPAQGVSIHASRVGGDICRRSNRNACHVSIHASRVGGDKRRKYCSPPGVFQSTPPVWEATRVQRQTS